MQNFNLKIQISTNRVNQFLKFDVGPPYCVDDINRPTGETIAPTREMLVAAQPNPYAQPYEKHSPRISHPSKTSLEKLVQQLIEMIPQITERMQKVLKF